MEPILFCLLIMTGLFAGFMSGILDVGGGFIFAPVMYFVLEMSGVAPETAILVAFGTSLAVALPTVLTSAAGSYENEKRECDLARFDDSRGFSDSDSYRILILTGLTG